MSGERRPDRQANEEPSLGMSIGLLCALLFAMFAIVGNVSIPDVQFVQTDFLAGRHTVHPSKTRDAPSHPLPLACQTYICLLYTSPSPRDS